LLGLCLRSPARLLLLHTASRPLLLLGQSLWLLGQSLWLLGQSLWLLGKSLWLLGQSLWLLGPSLWLLGQSLWLLGQSLLLQLAWPGTCQLLHSTHSPKLSPLLPRLACLLLSRLPCLLLYCVACFLLSGLPCLLLYCLACLLMLLDVLLLLGRERSSFLLALCFPQPPCSGGFSAAPVLWGFPQPPRNTGCG